jgi:hypothetical protein
LPIDRLDVVVSGVRQLTEQVREFVLTPAAGVRLPAFDAGAHVVLHLDTARGPFCGTARWSAVMPRRATARITPVLSWEPACVRSESFASAPVGDDSGFALVLSCLGMSDAADEALNPDTHWLDDPHWKSVSGSFHMHADYVAMHENLLDQTHFPFLHPGAIGTPEFARSRLQVREEGDVIVIDRELKDSPPPGAYAMPTGLTGKLVHRHSEAGFRV